MRLASGTQTARITAIHMIDTSLLQEAAPEMLRAELIGSTRRILDLP